MTKEELLVILRNKTADRELDHVISDDALLDFIDDDEITAAFRSIYKWYA